MNETLFFWILGVVGAIILILLGIIGYFLANNVQALKDVEKAVHTLDKSLGIINERTNNNENEHNTFSHRLNEHSKQLHDQEKEIAVIKSKLKVD